ncbi:bifunctional 2-C-methyl-D-erythritol 4-phosphate cytidylyltransferase/2-C-methyl-D-erythritol 2,4-cyclodiphosphate synthase [Shimia ponticola]|uniref:bifunctional 2-C-methyl-D-erythritol 4-phosphate cytidylyltransferase/2-C-methyl-D-erythritol 2,4-cyclodiphosphate synthase n=1 Tax=Shimia ponticola TaxID=2582893 RepID=UPI0011BF1B5B|nr:bifunctional 2-C-methyl-D-erythritol 4-phosphate cytidylyltransferase/2-C-methyl-D-erythritol 2,4-cyclodiphosphate synthase [Shimia ponticola]
MNTKSQPTKSDASATPKVGAVIVAAGRGQRAGGPAPKQWQTLGTQTVAWHTLRAFARHPQIGPIVFVHHPDDLEQVNELRNDYAFTPVPGGADRSASVRAGLEALDGTAVAKVLIHDVARPGVSDDLIDRVIAALDQATGAAPALAVTDALWRGDPSTGTVASTVDRTDLFRAQTPQGFHLETILAAHRDIQGGAADDVEVARAAGVDVVIVEGDEANLKITHPQDFDRAARILETTGMDIRLGNGFDVHKFGPGDAVTLCGVTVPFDKGLVGHSDADVGMHAVTDAIYGALAAGDIGTHFPPSDLQWKGAASHIFLEHAVNLAQSRGFRIANADCTLICEFPKIGPHAEAMRQEMARIMGMDVNRISVKATTSEQLGFTGRGEGIAALATATLVAI